MNLATTTASTTSNPSVPVTPPYEYEHRPRPQQEKRLPFFEDHHMVEDHSSASGSEDDHDGPLAHPASIPSPPELTHDSEEDDEESLSLPSLPDHAAHHRRKSVPHRSPSVSMDAFQASALDKSIVFQLDVNPSDAICDCTSKVICGESLLSALRKRVALARDASRKRPTKLKSHRKLRQATQIEIPRAPRHIPDTKRSIAMEHSPRSDSQREALFEEDADTGSSEMEEDSAAEELDRLPKKTAPRHTHSSGRPSRVKGPCQACHEASDGCMRKAFNWPFPSSEIFNDKGKPFVYLCNKCGLRYNKSGGCVCRHCRWVFCKEEKRKAMQHIEQMRRSRPDGVVYPDEDIENFVCTPKYWSCGRPWKVGWVLNSQDDEDDFTHSPPL